jgi:hypothetical protein
MALTFMAYCPTCKKKVMAMPLQSREDLIAALDNAIDVPVGEYCQSCEFHRKTVLDNIVKGGYQSNCSSDCQCP